MTDVSGIPNMGFGGGGYFGGIPNQQPAMSAAQINAGMWGNYSPGAAQATQNNIYGAGGFGAQPAYYAGLGAAYGRATGGFIPGGSRSMNAMRTGGGIGSDAARAPDQPPILPQYNGPASYGWDTNEGAPVPQQSYTPPMGQFAPQVYGWDHNEGLPGAIPGGSRSMNAMRSGQNFNYLNPNPMGPAQSFQLPQLNFNDRYVQPPPRQIQSPYGPGGYPQMEPRVPGQQSDATFGMGFPNGLPLGWSNSFNT
jgi:hypothetical protein